MVQGVNNFYEQGLSKRYSEDLESKVLVFRDYGFFVKVE